MTRGIFVSLKKVYVEITNICNLSCTFCHSTKREKRFLSPDDFRLFAEKIRPQTEYIYLHVLGEPLLHPRLKEILDICAGLKFKVTITTNGTLLREKAAVLLDCSALYKVSVSLHSFEANEKHAVLEDYMTAVCSFAAKAAKKGVICVFRLWNGGGADTLNSDINALLSDRFPGPYKENRSGVTLAKNIYLEYGNRFDWPDLSADEAGTRFCMGLRDQVGVLCDGTVVPCCLDAEGDIPLGNLYEQSLEEILMSDRAKSITDGFSNGKAVEELCRRCGYAGKKFGGV